VPTKFATLMLAKAMDSHNTMLALVRLKSMRVSINFQKPGMRPTK
jgi:hypothetical protein